MAMRARPNYQLGEFLVEPGRNLISRNGASITLEPRAMDVLLALIDHAGEVVSNEDLLETVWKGLVVEEATVYQRVSKIRQALGDNPQNPDYIENLPRRGYRLVADVRIAPEIASDHEPKQSDCGPIKIGEWSLDLETGALSNGQAVRYLPPRNASVLHYLARHASTTISTEQLRTDLWPNPHSTDAAVQKVISELRAALGDSHDHPRYLQTLPKRGYRLIAAVEVPNGERARESSPAASRERAGRVSLFRRFPGPLWLVIAVVACGLAGATFLFRAPSVIEPAPTIAVLPFENMSPHPDHAYFAAGIYEETLNQLAKIDDLGLIGRTTMARYANSGKSITQIGSELNVSAVMEGTVRYADERVRMTVHLSDAGTGKQLWSQAYEGNLKDIFAVQFDIAMKITGALEAEFNLQDQQSIAAIPTRHLNAHSAYVKGLALIRELPPRLPEALEAFQTAIEADPQFADALGAKALVHVTFVTMESAPGLSRELEVQQIQAAKSLAERALRIDPSQARALLALSRTNYLERRFEEALGLARATFENAPNSAFAAYGYARQLSFHDPDEAIPLFDRAIALDPLNPNYPIIAVASMVESSRFSEARRYAKQAMQIAPDNYYPYFAGAWIEAFSGNLERGGDLIDRARALVSSRVTPHEQLNFLQVYALLGRQREANEIFRSVLSLDNLNDGHLFRAYRIHGDLDKALEHLHSAIDKGYPAMDLSDIVLKQRLPVFDAIRTHPRFRDALDKLAAIDIPEQSGS